MKSTTPLLVLALGLAAGWSGSAIAQDPAGPQQPDMPEGQPEIVIRSENGLRVQPDPDNPERTLVVYTGDVVLLHGPQNLDLRCQRLELYFDQNGGAASAEAGADAAVEAAQGNEAGAANQAAGMGGGQIEQIIAIGQVEIVKVGDDDVANIARAGHAVYQPDTGTVTLTRDPQVQDDRRWVRSTGPDAVITLAEDGQHYAEGQTETILLGGAGER